MQYVFLPAAVVNGWLFAWLGSVVLNRFTKKRNFK